jgi:hypothetical protein
LGLCLINARVFDVLQAKAEEDGARSFLPLFKFEEMEDRVGLRGEDVYFFDKCKAAGLPIHCDHGLSWDVGHCMEMLLTCETAEEQRESLAGVREVQGRQVRGQGGQAGGAG